MIRVIYIVFSIAIVLASQVAVAQEERSRPKLEYLHDTRSYIHNPQYQGMVRRAFKYQPDDFRFQRFRAHYSGTSWYDPVADKVRDDMLNHAYNILYNKNPRIVQESKEHYKKIVGDHLASVGVVVEALALARADKRFGDPEFFRWMSSGLMGVVLNSGDGKTLATSYHVNTADEEIFLIRHLNLKLIKTDSRHIGHIYYNMHLVHDFTSDEEFTLFVDVSRPFSKMEKEANKSNYGLDILRQ